MRERARRVDISSKRNILTRSRGRRSAADACLRRARASAATPSARRRLPGSRSGRMPGRDRAQARAVWPRQCSERRRRRARRRTERAAADGRRSRDADSQEGARAPRPCSSVLRRKAVFLVSQKDGDESGRHPDETSRKNDPDQETREQAVFWLVQVPSDRAVPLLEDISRTPRTRRSRTRRCSRSRSRATRGTADPARLRRARQRERASCARRRSSGSASVTPQDNASSSSRSTVAADNEDAQGQDYFSLSQQPARQRAVAHEHRAQPEGRHRAAQEGAVLGRAERGRDHRGVREPVRRDDGLRRSRSRSSSCSRSGSATARRSTS